MVTLICFEISTHRLQLCLNNGIRRFRKVSFVIVVKMNNAVNASFFFYSSVAFLDVKSNPWFVVLYFLKYMNNLI